MLLIAWCARSSCWFLPLISYYIFMCALLHYYDHNYGLGEGALLGGLVECNILYVYF